MGDHERLLLRLVRRDGSRHTTADQLAPLAGPEFRRAFVAVATGHGVIGLALTAVRRSPGFASLEAATRHAISAPLRPFSMQAALWDAERDRLLEVMSAHDLVPLVLKGGALRSTVYSDPVERLSGDLDLLVPPHRVTDALTALAAAGYVDHWTEEARREHLRRGYHLSLSRPSGFEVELHWDLNSRGEGFRLDTAAFLNRSEVCRRADAPPIRVPAAEDMVLHLAYQNREDDFSRLKRLVDIDRVVRSRSGAGREFDWAYLEWKARRGGLRIVTGLALRLCERLLDTPVPSGTVRRLRLDPAARLHLGLLRPEAHLLSQHAFRSTVARRMLQLWLVHGWRSRARWVRRFLGGGTNPMARVYAERKGAPIRRTPAAVARRARRLTKVAAYHLILYAVGLRALMGSRRGRRPTFWSESAFSHRSAGQERLSKGAVWTSPASRIS